jgi:multidrug efflux pump subunit AcrB
LPFEISIEIPELSLRKFDLTLEQVADVIRQNSRVVSAENFKTQGGNTFIRSRGQAYRASEFADIPIITTQDGTTIKLNDIAIIKDGFEETPLRIRFNGVSAVEVEIFCTGDESIIEVTQAVKDFILEQQTILPHGLSMDY